MEQDIARGSEGIDRFGIRGLVVTFVLILFSFVVLFVSAGKLDWANAWVYFAIVIAYQVVYTVALVRLNPGMLNERGKFAKEGTKGFDRVYFFLYIPVTLGGLVVIGLDARYAWSHVPWWVSAIGAVVLIVSFVPGLWALAVNPFFECTVRIQKDREQQVVSRGPYRFLRHPGYLALILSLLSAPLILGSWWGLIPFTSIVLGVIARTALEDRTLRKELPGYKEYSAATRYLLIPFVW